MLIIDIEMFSQINASLGRAGGDKLLKEVAERLNSIVRKSDGVARLSVSRVAGDEFAVLFNDIPKKEQVTWAVKRLMDVVNQPVEIDGNTIHLNCHVGISLYPTDADSVEGLLNNAMSAKQYSKNPQIGIRLPVLRSPRAGTFRQTYASRGRNCIGQSKTKSGFSFTNPSWMSHGER